MWRGVSPGRGVSPDRSRGRIERRATGERSSHDRDRAAGLRLAAPLAAPRRRAAPDRSVWSGEACSRTGTPRPPSDPPSIVHFMSMLKQSTGMGGNHPSTPEKHPARAGVQWSFWWAYPPSAGQQERARASPRGAICQPRCPSRCCWCSSRRTRGVAPKATRGRWTCHPVASAPTNASVRLNTPKMVIVTMAVRTLITTLAISGPIVMIVSRSRDAACCRLRACRRRRHHRNHHCHRCRSSRRGCLLRASHPRRPRRRCCHRAACARTRVLEGRRSSSTTARATMVAPARCTKTATWEQTARTVRVALARTLTHVTRGAARLSCPVPSGAAKYGVTHTSDHPVCGYVIRWQAASIDATCRRPHPPSRHPCHLVALHRRWLHHWHRQVHCSPTATASTRASEARSMQSMGCACHVHMNMTCAQRACA